MWIVHAVGDRGGCVTRSRRSRGARTSEKRISERTPWAYSFNVRLESLTYFGQCVRLESLTYFGQCVRLESLTYLTTSGWKA